MRTTRFGCTDIPEIVEALTVLEISKEGEIGVPMSGELTDSCKIRWEASFAGIVLVRARDCVCEGVTILTIFRDLLGVSSSTVFTRHSKPICKVITRKRTTLTKTFPFEEIQIRVIKHGENNSEKTIAKKDREVKRMVDVTRSIGGERTI